MRITRNLLSAFATSRKQRRWRAEARRKSCSAVVRAENLEGRVLLAGVVAQSGFNDASGINSNATPDSPFNLGESPDGQGAGEAGWNGQWFVTTGDAVVEAVSGGFEGDGAAAFFQNTAAISRILTNPITTVTRIDYRVMIPGDIDVDVIFRIEDSTQGPTDSIAAQVNVGSDFQLYVVDGSNVEATGLFLTQGSFHTVGIEIDPANETFRVSLDGTFFNGPDPLNFRGTPTQIDEVHYLNEIASPRGSYLDSVVVTEGPFVSPFSLAAPIPGRAGVSNTFKVTGAVPGQLVEFWWGTARGAKQVPNNPDLVLGINRAKKLGSSVTNAAGVAQVTKFVGNRYAGKTLYYQAVSTASQQLTEVVEFTYPPRSRNSVSSTSNNQRTTVTSTNLTDDASSSSKASTLSTTSEGKSILRRRGNESDGTAKRNAPSRSIPFVESAGKKADRIALNALFASIGSTEKSDELTSL